MYILNGDLLNDAHATNRLRTELLGQIFAAQQEAERSLQSARAYFREAADLASLMVEATDNEDLSRKREESQWKQNEAVGHRSDAFIALGIAIEKQAELDALLGVYPSEEE